MKAQTAKAAKGTNQSSLLNQFNQLGDDRTVFAFNSKTNSQIKQYLCRCGSAISPDARIFNKSRLCADCEKAQVILELEILTITRTVRKPKKAFPCITCRKHFAPEKMCIYSNTG
jgi:hypothetical protein